MRYSCLFLGFLINLAGCASVCQRDAKEGDVIAAQNRIIKKLVTLRESPEFQSRLANDPVLVEQESVLMRGLSGVIESQESLIKVHDKSKLCGGKIAK
ncbi:MAG: hypothetical protein AB7G93_13410 [Bdellovibrionales bacterium]